MTTGIEPVVEHCCDGWYEAVATPYRAGVVIEGGMACEDAIPTKEEARKCAESLAEDIAGLTGLPVLPTRETCDPQDVIR